MSAAPETPQETAGPKPQRNDLLRALFVIDLLLFIGVNVVIAVRIFQHTVGLFESLYSLYWFNAIELAPLLLITGIIGALAWRRGVCRERWLKFCSVLTFALGSLIGATTIYATQIEPRLLRVDTITIPTDKLTKPLRILQISDIQTQEVSAYDRHAFDLMRAANADLIIENGDTIQPRDNHGFDALAAEIAPLFASLHPPLGIYHSQGDVDFGLRGYREIGGLGGMKFLYNEEVNLTAPDGTPIHLLCLDLPDSRGRVSSKERVHAWFASHPDGLTILAGHAPDFILENSDLPIDLCLAGHTHGGQVRFPHIGPLMILSRIPKYLAMGFHEFGKTRINVSSGIGAEHAGKLPSIRINCRPSMTIIDFVPRASGQEKP